MLMSVFRSLSSTLGQVCRRIRAVLKRPIMSARLKWSVVVIVVLTAIAVRTLCPRSTDYPMKEFLYSITSAPQPSSWRDRFSREYIEWMLRGRPTDAQLFDRAQDYERELLQRGAFEQKEFVLQYRPPSRMTSVEIGALLTRLGSDRKWRARLSDRSPRFTITTTPRNMRVFEAAIRKYDQSFEHSKGSDQMAQDGAANGSQPFSSETNPTPSAAGSRR